MSVATISSIACTARCSTSVVPWAASDASCSPAGIAVDAREWRVRITVWATSGSVSSLRSAAAAAANAGTPGVTSQGSRARRGGASARRARCRSRGRRNAGARRRRRARARRAAPRRSGRARGCWVSTRRAPAGAWSSTSAGTSEPA